MGFSFIHTGDWHLAKPFGRFDADKAVLLREARARIVDRVATLARRLEAQAVLVAGDVFDSPAVAEPVLRRLAAHLEQYRDIAWHFLPGNHDPAVANGVWQRFARHVTGDHVAIHLERGRHAIADGVELLVAPLAASQTSHDPTQWMDDEASPPGFVRIGLAHGAVSGFGSAGTAGTMIDPDRARASGLDYLALGDWHGCKSIRPNTWYAGTPEPDRFLDNDPGFVLFVRVAAAGGSVAVEPVDLAEYRWLARTIEAGASVALAAVERQVEALGAGARQALLKLAVTGTATLGREIELKRRCARLADLTFHTHADFSGLAIDTDSVGEASFDDPLVGAVAGRLSAAYVSSDDAVDRDTARHALGLLAGFVRDHGAGR